MVFTAFSLCMATTCPSSCSIYSNRTTSSASSSARKWVALVTDNWRTSTPRNHTGPNRGFRFRPVRRHEQPCYRRSRQAPARFTISNLRKRFCSGFGLTLAGAGNCAARAGNARTLAALGTCSAQPCHLRSRRPCLRGLGRSFVCALDVEHSRRLRSAPANQSRRNCHSCLDCKRRTCSAPRFWDSSR